MKSKFHYGQKFHSNREPKRVEWHLQGLGTTSTCGRLALFAVTLSIKSSPLTRLSQCPTVLVKAISLYEKAFLPVPFLIVKKLLSVSLVIPSTSSLGRWPLRTRLWPWPQPRPRPWLHRWPQPLLPLMLLVVLPSSAVLLQMLHRHGKIIMN